MARATGQLGAKVRSLRQKRRIPQVELARRLGISPSYMNLIEHDQRPLSATLLLRLAEELGVDLGQFTGAADGHLQGDLAEAFADPLFDDHGLGPADARELAASSPALARALLGLYRSYRDARSSADMLASQIYDDQQVVAHPRARLPSEEVTDFIQRHNNFFEEIEEAAERLRAEARIDQFDVVRGLVRHLGDRFGVEVRTGRQGHRDGVVRRYDGDRRRLWLSELVPASSRSFQLAAQLGLLAEPDLFARLSADPELGSPQSRALCRVVLANYFAGAVLMPYGAFLEAARTQRYDVELLQHRFGASFEQICHRFTSLRRPGAEGVPFHMIRVDLAGNISKRFSASGIRFARFSGACPRWNVFSAFVTPGVIRVQVSIMEDGEVYFCLARTVIKGRGGYHAPQTLHAVGLGCQVRHATQLVYSDGIDLDNLEGAVPVGVTCRLCARRDCEQRAFPSIRAGIAVDENVRGPSVFAPHGGDD